MAANQDRHVTRRRLLAMGGAGVATLSLGRASALRAVGAPRLSGYPFSLGVASGDPTPDGAVLWTRLAPAPEDGGGMPPRPVAVRWEVSEDERFRRVAASGEQIARAEWAHSVHVEVDGLRPGREYFYRFRSLGETSPVGRTKTAPPAGALTPLRFAFASCQHYEHGYYTAYRHMSEEDLDVVLHLGDYIYEFGPGEYPSPTGTVRRYSQPTPVTLDEYRVRHAEHRSDPDLQAAHRAFPWVVTWDDHEVCDNYAGARSAGADPVAFARRRAAAYQAYYEHMPLRRRSKPRAGRMSLYRRIDHGDLVAFNVLDTRQYRDVQAPVGSAAWRDPRRTLTGPRQERWLGASLRSGARWNVLAQQVFFARRDGDPGPQEQLATDSWDGYPAARERLTRALAHPAVTNPIILSGDVHSSWANHVLADYDDPRSKVVATEFVGTSISSGGDGTGSDAGAKPTMAANPHIKFFNGRRGYVRCRVDEHEWRTDYRTVPFVSRRGAGIDTVASMTVQDGKAGLAGSVRAFGPGRSRHRRSPALRNAA